nr:LysM peptidoglycan-binding domain-containing protein [Sneathiella limimaris]
MLILVVLILAAAGLMFFFWTDQQPEQVANQSVPTTENKSSAAATKDNQTQTANSSSTDTETSKAVSEETAKLTDTDKPVILEKDNPNEQIKQSGILPMLPPRFDVVRVDQNCGILVAGRAEPTSVVTIYANEKELGSALSSRRGEWVFVGTDPLPAGAQKINAKALNPDKNVMETPRMVVMNVPDCSKATEEREPAIAVLTPKEGAAKTEVEQRVSKLLQSPEPEGNLEAAEELNVASIDYDDQGNVALAGKGKRGGQVRVYLKNKHIGTAKIDEDGNWRLAPEMEIVPGTYDLRVDQLDADGNVISRVEIPFKREAAEDVILAKGGLEIRAVVQPGNSLWRIARRIYGEGLKYTLIYQANETQIKDPDLIYPGQIFTLPSEEDNG